MLMLVYTFVFRKSLGTRLLPALRQLSYHHPHNGISVMVFFFHLKTSNISVEGFNFNGFCLSHLQESKETEQAKRK